MYNIIQKRKIWLTLSGAMVGLSIIALVMWGFNFGIDFTGGSLLEVEFKQYRPDVKEVQAAVADLDLNSLVVQPIGERGIILRFQETGEEIHQEVLNRLKDITVEIGEPAIKKEIEAGSEKFISEVDIGEIVIGTSSESTTTLDTSTDAPSQARDASADLLEELRFDSVGPSIGRELKQKSLTATMLVLIAIVLYIAWVFRKVSKPVASWKYGLTAIIALFHDVMITLGIFAVLGEFFNVEINTPFVAAILTVLGYSVNDTIVVFDRLRENLPKSEEDFEGTVNISVNQTIKRSINTSLTTLLVLLSILFFGGGTIKDFVLALSIGVFIGTYSSIFLASPMLVIWEKLKK